MDDSAIICDEVTDADAEAKLNDETKTIPTNFNEKKTTCTMQNFYISLAFLLVTIALLIGYYLLLFDKISSKTKIYYHLNSQITN